MNLSPDELLNPMVTANMPITQHPTLNYVFYLPPLPVGATGMITITATVDPAITAEMVLTNVVYLDGAPVDVDPMNNFADSRLTVTLEPVEPEPTLLYFPAIFSVNGQQSNNNNQVPLLSRQPTVEIAHAALLREWTRLRDWLDESRNDIRLQRLLATAVSKWQLSEQNPGFLLLTLVFKPMTRRKRPLPVPTPQPQPKAALMATCSGGTSKRGAYPASDRP